MQLPSMHSQQMSPVFSIGEELLISVLPNGKIVLDGSVLDIDIHNRNLPLLEGKLKQYKDAADLMSTQTFVIVNADDESQFQRFIDVFNTLSKVGIRNIYLTGLALAD
jgi:biopolymer transport protein ExbD